MEGLSVRWCRQAPCSGVNENNLTGSCLNTLLLVPWWNCLGRGRRCGLVIGDVLLGRGL